MSYSLTSRTQYTFEASNKTLACLLTKAAKAEINIVAISINELGSRFCKKLVNIVVGTPDPANNNNMSQNNCFKKILCELCIKFEEICVIQVFNIETVTPTPSSYRIVYVHLICCGIDVIASYLGQPIAGQVVSTFFQVPQCQLQKAINAINCINTSAPDCNLCINLCNVDCVCDCNKKEKKTKCKCNCKDR
jgi:hypothetical protein